MGSSDPDLSKDRPFHCCRGMTSHGKEIALPLSVILFSVNPSPSLANLRPLPSLPPPLNPSLCKKKGVTPPKGVT